MARRTLTSESPGRKIEGNGSSGSKRSRHITEKAAQGQRGELAKKNIPMKTKIIIWDTRGVKNVKQEEHHKML